MAPKPSQLVIGAIALSVILIIICILFGASFAVVKPTQVGIEYSTFSKVLNEDRIYPGGRYFLGLGKSFILFPIVLDIIDFSSDDDEGGSSLSGFASGGQTVILDISFYYRLDDTKVIDLYKLARTNYKPRMIKEATTALKDVISDFEFLQYFSDRETIALRMRDAVNDALYNNYFARVPLLQLRNIAVSSQVEESLIDLVIAEQTIRREQLLRNITLIQEDTLVQSAIFEKGTTIALEEANSKGFKIEQAAVAEGERLVVETEANAWKSFTESVGLTNSSQLLKYITTKTIRDASSDRTILVGFEGATPIVVGS
eukprot:TRINITY_DN11636_c0_g1_i1.p1 TRINITY_DN11636_c0_g1~~TRINITY_DN11636_c0_g1_i1.p1  ORF type:complete len:315 (-),score=66.55 TRINITY_DN11636_c0_g1_i1:48-992(-)